MLNWLRQKIFGPDPQIGEIWEQNLECPFDNPSKWKILDIKGIWIKYVPMHNPDKLFRSSRRSSFKIYYRKSNDQAC